MRSGNQTNEVVSRNKKRLLMESECEVKNVMERNGSECEVGKLRLGIFIWSNRR